MITVEAKRLLAVIDAAATAAAKHSDRLAARINDLRRAGYLIASEKRRLPNGKTVAEYSLVGKLKGESDGIGE